MKSLRVVGLGMFLAMTYAASAATIDTTTQGNWIGVYGGTDAGEGYILANYAPASPGDATFYGAASPTRDLTVLPGYVSGYSYLNGAQQYMWIADTADVRAVDNPFVGAPDRRATTTFDNDNWDIEFTITRPIQFRLGVYVLDWDNFNTRDITVQLGSDSAIVNNTSPSSNAYFNGAWVLFDVNADAGPLTLNLIENDDPLINSNIVISAITFDLPEPTSGMLALIGGFGLVATHRRRRSDSKAV